MKGMIKTRFIGVYRYVSDTKRFDGKPDECFYYSYRDQDKKFCWHKVGWRSEKVTAQYAADKRSEFLVSARNDEAPKRTRKNNGITFGKGFEIFEEKWFPDLKNNGADIALRYRVHTAPVFADKPIDKISLFTIGHVDQKTINFISQETGLFPTDVCYLHLECVDMERGIITFRKRNSAKYKTYRITEAVRPLFEEWVGKYSSDWIFTGHGGKRIGSNKTKTFDRSTSECGLNPAGIDSLDRVVFHTLRYTYCSRETIKGTPLFKIARLVGHKTTTMTERYAYLCPVTESQNLITKDNGTILEPLNSMLAQLIEEKGIEHVPQSVFDWLARAG